jgi:ribonuclease HI
MVNVDSYQLFTDGGARGNPGPAAVGVVLLNSKGKEVSAFGKTIGSTTNNQAEYQALLAGLQLAKQHNVSSLHCYLDSELVVKQLNQEYRVKDKQLAPLFMKVWNLSQEFSLVTFSHVRREKNQRADELVNQALDAVSA